MSNASLKEQLQTLGLSTPATEKPQFSKKKQRPEKVERAERAEKTEKVVKKQKPAWLEQAQYGVELLKAHFPACFKEVKEIQPVKVGIKQDLVKHLSSREDIVISDKACMVSSLAYYVNSPAYHKHVLEGANRVDLDGNPAGVVTAEEAQYSRDCRKAKLQKKQSADQSAALKSNLETVK